ncbi:ParB/RepB/Spo0J family partition protein [Clostridium formicaceticum]|uniref:Nucleoid occlusion protein n=1 Tax=Clostridium formicaceticum TaxID=1497 RepID=A0AAC9WIK1_9CLOT|nr:ParB/RepB/Spo0J family partition protein [Clostridium formicaceticum]AOY75407.1 nucleoid occlusion protein [Clostridium formicaceticum]ARE89864.1 Nucleoid occlusion protein [Clostridium formicaceticum]
MSATERKVLEICIDSVISNPYQPRKTFSQASLQELSQSIKVYGVLQPISVRQIGEGKYELIAGERRVKAAKLANLKTIPAIINHQISDKDSAILAIIENLQREDLNFIEEAEGYFNLIEDHGLTQQELAIRIGKNQSTIANKLRILRLREDIKQKLLESHLTERHARALLKLPDDELRVLALEKVIKNDYNVKKTEELIQSMLEEITAEEEPKRQQKIKSFMNYKIYINTIKQAYDAIKDKQEKAEFKQVDKGDFIEVTVKIPKG